MMPSLCAGLCTAVGGGSLLLLCWAVLLLTSFLWSQLKPGSLLVGQFGSPLFPLVVLLFCCGCYCFSAGFVFSSCRSGFSYPICLLTPPAVVICFSLRASHTFSPAVLRMHGLGHLVSQ
jgi:hypothetical protein